MPVNDCPLCLLAALTERTESGGYAIACTRCGAFSLNDCARIMVQGLPTHLRIALAKVVQERTAQGNTVSITVQNIAQLVSPYLEALI